jgi:PAS domain S-box-containing protein
MKNHQSTMNYERLSLILEATSEGWWEWDIKNQETYLSPVWYKMLGYEPNELPTSYEEWENLLHPEDRESTIEQQNECMKHRESWELVFRMKHKEGKYLHIRSRGKVLERNTQGEATKVVGMHQDITEQIKTERLLEESQEKIDLLNGIIKVAPSSFSIFNLLEKRIVHSTHLKHLNLNLEGDVVKNIVHPEDRFLVDKHLKKIKESKNGEVFSVIFRIICLDDKIAWILIRDTIYRRDKDGNALQCIGSALDVSNFMQYKQELSKTLSVIREISHTNAHELRGPVSTLLGIIALLNEEELMQSEDYQESQELIGYLAHTVQKLDAIIHEINREIEDG